MTETNQLQGRGRTLLRWLFIAAFLLSIFLSGLFSGLVNGAGLFYLLFGSVAAVFMDFSWTEMRSAFAHAFGRSGSREALSRSAHFWQAATRNAWMLGALGSALNFTTALATSGVIADISNRMIQSFIVTLYGLVLAVICLVPAMKLAAQAEKTPSAGTSRPASVGRLLYERVTGYGLFAVVLGLTLHSLLRNIPRNSHLPLAKLLLHWPAILVVFGGAVAIGLFIGAGAGARAWTIGFAMMGFIALLIGLIQALFGFTRTNFDEIGTATAFIISSSSFALLGLTIIAAPLEDREVMAGRREQPGPLSRMIWIVFPLLVNIFLFAAFIMVLVPVKKPAGM